ncbi:hypothetical protein [Egicoccus sp. AB-alg2]|uniref:hypothetical protein n=1 Tax=Egicoccus sp. AB-alg2 TaxID=3242693 RepID=UPI00359EE5D8
MHPDQLADLATLETAAARADAAARRQTRRARRTERSARRQARRDRRQGSTRPVDTRPRRDGGQATDR